MNPNNWLILPLPPSHNRYWRCVGRGRVLVSQKGREFKERCAWVAAAQHLGEPLEGDVCVSVMFFFRDRRGDLDNKIKPLLDALEGTVYNNDRQIVTLVAQRKIDRDNPRCEVYVFHPQTHHYPPKLLS